MRRRATNSPSTSTTDPTDSDAVAATDSDSANATAATPSIVEAAKSRVAAEAAQQPEGEDADVEHSALQGAAVELHDEGAQLGDTKGAPCSVSAAFRGNLSDAALRAALKNDCVSSSAQERLGLLYCSSVAGGGGQPVESRGEGRRPHSGALCTSWTRLVSWADVLVMNAGAHGMPLAL